MGNGSGNLDSGEQDSLLSLEVNVFRPSHEPGQVAFWLNVVANAEIAGTFLEKRVGFLLNLLCTLFSFRSFGLSYNNFTIIAT